jgi:hypothetical protein
MPALEVARECANAAMGGLNADANISECVNAGFAALEVPIFRYKLHIYNYIELSKMFMAFRRI